MPDIATLRFNACAYFYRLKAGQSFSNDELRSMMRQVTSTKIAHYLFDELRVDGPDNTKYSLRVFKEHPKTPGFMTVSENGWKEQKIGYFLFIEYGEYVAVLRKNCTIPKDYAAKLEHIDYDRLIALYAGMDTQFHKMSMQNLDASDHAMRYKSYEALNLKDNISPIGSSRYYLRSVKGANGDDRFALTLSASRINEFDADYTIADICGWVHNVVNEIIGVGGITSSFLKIFAKPEKYSDVYRFLEPSSLLVFYGLIMELHDEQHAQFYHVKDGARTLINDDLFYQYIQRVFVSAFIDYVDISQSGYGYDLKGKVKAINFVQKKDKEHKDEKLNSNPIVKLLTADDFGLTEDKEKKLSEIIAEINSKSGKAYDNDIVVKSMLQIRDLMLKSDKLKMAAKNNTEDDFNFAFFDNIDDALIEGLDQNQDFFSLLLNNDEMKRQVLGIFAGEIYHSVRQSK